MTTEEKEKLIKETMEEITAAGFKKLMLNEKEVAEVTGISTSSLCNWRKDGIGMPFKKMDGKRGKVMYPKRDLAEWIISGNIKVA